MKKIAVLIMILCLALAVSACGKDVGPTDDFKVPENYSSVLLVSINPQFKLYLDDKQEVLAIEAVNEDAKSIKDKIANEENNLEAVIKNIINEANKEGFLTEDATVNFEIVESSAEDSIQENILSIVEKSANAAAQEINIEIKVMTVNKHEEKPNDETTTTDTTSKEEQTTSNPTEDKPNSNTNSNKKPAHTHSFAAATCTDAKKCACGATEGNALGHNYKDGSCTRCNAKDPNYKPLTSVLNKNGKWTANFVSNNRLHMVEFSVCNGKSKTISVGFGDPLNSLPQEMQNDPDILDYCTKFNDKYYYLGMGTGDELSSVNESGTTVALVSSTNKSLVLTRTGENTLLCSSGHDAFSHIDIPSVPAGTVFTFVAE